MRASFTIVDFCRRGEQAGSVCGAEGTSTVVKCVSRFTSFTHFFLSLANGHKLVLEEASPRESHGDVSWVVSTPRSPIPASLHLVALCSSIQTCLV